MFNTLNYIAPNNNDLVLTELSSLSYSLYDLLKRLIAKSLVSFIVLIFCLPILSILLIITLILLGIAHVAMIYVNYRLKKMITNDISITHRNYKKIRDSKNVIVQMLNHLDKINNHADTKFLLIRPFVNQGKVTHSHLKDFYSKINNTVNNLDNINHPSVEFDHISQEDLWNNRSKAYKYLV